MDRFVPYRTLLLLRGEPERFAELLPKGWSVAEHRGLGLVELTFTRRPLPPRPWREANASGDRLTWSLHARSASGRRRRWILARRTSSWLRARLERASMPSLFDLDDHDGRCELRVATEGREELYLRASPRPEARGSVFGSVREAEAKLLHEVPHRGERHPERWSLGALDVHELRLGAESGVLSTGGLELDSAWRCSTVRPSSSSSTVAHEGPGLNAAIVPS